MDINYRDLSTAEEAAFCIRKSILFSMRRPRFDHGSFDNSLYKNEQSILISLDLSF